MTELPHPDEFAALGEEQRALVLLNTLDAGPQTNNARRNIVSFELAKYWPGSSINHYVMGPGRPQVAHREWMQLVEEAFDWLLQERLLTVDRAQRSSNWVIVTDRGRKVRESDGDAGLRAIEAQKLLAIPLHDRLDGARRDFREGDYETAVFKAIRAVEIAVREAADYEPRDVGKDLMMKAWAPGTGALADPELMHAEQDGFKFLFAGAVAAFKNPTSHREVNYEDPAEVAEIVMMADLLLRIVDRAARRRA